MRNWTKISREKINHIDTIKEFLDNNAGGKVYIGTDSKFFKRSEHGFSVTYITVIALDPGTKRGANIILCKEYIKGQGVDERITIFDRLWKEIEITREIALDIRENAGVDPEIHIDINPKENAKSNRLYAAAIGYMLESGFEVKGKPDGPVASCAADHYLKYGY